MALRVGFVTCVQLGLDCLAAIDRAGGRLDVVFTLHDHLAAAKSGRVYLDDFCAQRGVALEKIRHINDPGTVGRLMGLGLDWLFIVGWSQVASAPILATLRRGALGIHPTLLPEGRGRAAIPWTILNGLVETGVTLFQLDEGVDTGPIIAQERISVLPGEDATSLYRKVGDAHARVVAGVWPDLVSNRVLAVPQVESRATYWRERKPEDGRIVSSMTMEDVDRLVRATTHPYPGAFFDGPGNAYRLRVWRGFVSPSGQATAPRSQILRLANGWYEAVAFDLEAGTA